MADLHILAVVGSLRKQSLNLALARETAAVMPQGSRLTIYDRLGDLPLFNSDVADHPAVLHWNEAVTAADGVLFVTPEYNYSIPGVLKNAIDWASRGKPSPLHRKPTAIMGSAVGVSGSIRAQNHLRGIMVYFDAPTMSQPEFVLPRAFEKFSPSGELTDIATRDFLTVYSAAVVDWVSRNKTSTLAEKTKSLE